MEKVSRQLHHQPILRATNPPELWVRRTSLSSHPHLHISWSEFSNPEPDGLLPEWLSNPTQWFSCAAVLSSTNVSVWNPRPPILWPGGFAPTSFRSRWAADRQIDIMKSSQFAVLVRSSVRSPAFHPRIIFLLRPTRSPSPTGEGDPLSPNFFQKPCQVVMFGFAEPRQMAIVAQNFLYDMVDTFRQTIAKSRNPTSSPSRKKKKKSREGKQQNTRWKKRDE
ncbi:hypothetical protein B0T20DRAFT_47039 [Sordaria brevicollis]|uniref:Uncharacterized protein n=1 Tax=Sordaria brevicollis TaxID=83679 RepID=A0AAE0P9V7_SORBR|nr:hypothetical protein B0T20DRAFT_47039 [Sordaria brevicollis]